ncbi:MAG: hypothetical protein DME65_11410 [Verrucomicrobia bacterium]|nr:MAG: hypothetical protein DME65_11410 [Verrucomicrobiota bacterium]
MRCPATSTNRSWNPNRLSARAKYDRMLPPAGGLVRDSQLIFEARFSCREPKRLIGIGFNWLTAAQMA